MIKKRDWELGIGNWEWGTEKLGKNYKKRNWELGIGISLGGWRYMYTQTNGRKYKEIKEENYDEGRKKGIGMRSVDDRELKMFRGRRGGEG